MRDRQTLRQTYRQKETDRDTKRDRDRLNREAETNRTDMQPNMHGETVTSMHEKDHGPETDTSAARETDRQIGR